MAVDSRPFKGWRTGLTLLIGSGFGAIVTGLFGIGTELVKQSRATREQQCAIAAEVLLDEAPSPNIATAELQRLSGAAARRLETCLTEGNT